MAELSSVSGIAQIFRTDWELRGCDTLFECICGSFVMSQQAGKTVSRWTAKIGDLTVGGQPPTFDDVEGDHGKPQAFTSILFEDDFNGCWHPRVRELLVMALPLRHHQFSDVLESRPGVTPKPAGVVGMRHCFSHNHLFVCRVKQALKKSGIGEVQFGGWVSEAHNSFLSRNMPGLPIEKLQSCGGNKGQILMDPRTFVDHFNALSGVTQNLHANVISLQHAVNDLCCNQQTGRILDDCMIENFDKLTKSVTRIENQVCGEPSRASQTIPTSENGIIKFLVASKSLANQMSVSDVAVAFFVDDCMH